jgi:hypothetical protein
MSSSSTTCSPAAPPSRAQFFKYFWTTNAFIFAILGMAVLSAIYLMLKPRDTPVDSMKLKEQLRRNKRR